MSERRVPERGRVPDGGRASAARFPPRRGPSSLDIFAPPVYRYGVMKTLRPFMRLLAVGFLVVGTVASLSAFDWEERSIVHSEQFGTSVHPLGLSLSSRLSLAVPMYRNLEGVLWDPAKVEIGVINRITPALTT